MAYPATPKTWVAGDVLTAAQMNAELRDALLAAFPLAAGGVAAWTSYTPTLTQSATITKTVNSAKYTKVGRIVTVKVNLTCTSSGTALNPVIIGLPVAAAASDNGPIGQGLIYDASAVDDVAGLVILQSTTTVQLVSCRSAGNILGLGGGFNAALVNTDQVRFSAVYEAAT